MRTIYIKTWKCSCGYSQDFEPTDENNAIHFPRLPHGVCPSCKVGELLAVENEQNCVKVNIAEVGDTMGEKDGKVVLHTADTVASLEKVSQLEAKCFDKVEAEAWNVTPW